MLTLYVSYQQDRGYEPRLRRSESRLFFSDNFIRELSREYLFFEVDCFNNERDEDNLIYESMLLIKFKFEVTHKGWYLRGLDVTFIPINYLLSINIIC